jgi:hypothetical protein
LFERLSIGLNVLGNRRRLGVVSKRVPAISERASFSKEPTMLVTILVVLLILFLLGGGYGYRNGNNVLAGGGGLLGLVLVVVIVLFLMGHISV